MIHLKFTCEKDLADYGRIYVDCISVMVLISVMIVINVEFN